MSRNPIQDEYTDLEMTRQQKWSLRNREKQRKLEDRYNKSDKGKATRRGYYLSHRAVDKSEN
jgi:hypothetical protein